jgi:hypothetical protein
MSEHCRPRKMTNQSMRMGDLNALSLCHVHVHQGELNGLSPGRLLVSGPGVAWAQPGACLFQARGLCPGVRMTCFSSVPHSPDVGTGHHSPLTPWMVGSKQWRLGEPPHSILGALCVSACPEQGRRAVKVPLR